MTSAFFERWSFDLQTQIPGNTTEAEYKMWFNYSLFIQNVHLWAVQEYHATLEIDVAASSHSIISTLELTNLSTKPITADV